MTGAGSCDILVAGAGPAGAVAARQLARAGLSVVLAAALNDNVPKFGETLPGAGCRLLTKMGLGHLIDPGPYGGMVHCPVGGMLVAWNGDVLRNQDALTDPYGLGIRVDRSRLDADLRTAAIDAGAQWVRADVSRVSKSGRQWQALLGDGQLLRARWLVDATGRRACIIRKLGIPRQRGWPLVALYRVGNPVHNQALNRTLISADPGGWHYAGRMANGSWVFGYHTTAGHAARLQRQPTLWQRLQDENRVFGGYFGPISMEPAIHVHDARTIRLTEPLGDGWVACGDAALAFDPLAGQGLFNALYTGMAVGELLPKMLAGGASGMGYSAELADVAERYTARRCAIYRQERRWTAQPFWKNHQA